MRRIAKILVPVDFSEHSARALEMAIDLAKAFGAEIHLLHCYQVQPLSISPYGIVLPESFDRDVRQAAERRADEWSTKVTLEGIEVEVSLSSRFPSLEISETASEIGADLIVMGTRGLSGIRHVLLGSVAERTLRLAPCPVLTVKDSGQPERS
jgi:nucleotide-binding universal stress UspA family protein